MLVWCINKWAECARFVKLSIHLDSATVNSFFAPAKAVKFKFLQMFDLLNLHIHASKYAYQLRT